MSAPRRWLPVLAAGLAIGGAVRGAEAPLDTDFLEFLGSFDSEDDGWHDYLSAVNMNQRKTPAGKVAPAGKATPTGKVAASSAPVEAKPAKPMAEATSTKQVSAK